MISELFMFGVVTFIIGCLWEIRTMRRRIELLERGLELLANLTR